MKLQIFPREKKHCHVLHLYESHIDKLKLVALGLVSFLL